MNQIPAPAIPKAGSPTLTPAELICFLSVAMSGRVVVRGFEARPPVRLLISEGLITELEDDDDDDEEDEPPGAPGATHALTEKGKVFLTMLRDTPLPVSVSTYTDPRFPDTPVKVEQ